MAQQIVVHLTDDLDGSQAESTVVFGIDGRQYEIDLSSKNEAKLRKALEPFLAVARRHQGSGNGKRSGGQRASRGSDVDLAAVRQWARENGYEVSDRGRVSQQIRDAYDAAH